MPNERRKYSALLRFRSRTTWFTGSIAAVSVVLFAVNRAHFDLPLSLVVICVMAIVIVVQIPIARAEIRRMNALQRDDFLLCPTCGYSLVGLSSKGHCPECGEAFEHTALRQLWLSAIDEGAGEEKLEAPDTRFGHDLKD